jgi:hypothetical protein
MKALRKKAEDNFIREKINQILNVRVREDFERIRGRESHEEEYL